VDHRAAVLRAGPTADATWRGSAGFAPGPRGPLGLASRRPLAAASRFLCHTGAAAPTRTAGSGTAFLRATLCGFNRTVPGTLLPSAPGPRPPRCSAALGPGRCSGRASCCSTALGPRRSSARPRCRSAFGPGSCSARPPRWPSGPAIVPGGGPRRCSARLPSRSCGLAALLGTRRRWRCRSSGVPNGLRSSAVLGAPGRCGCCAVPGVGSPSG